MYHYYDDGPIMGSAPVGGRRGVPRYKKLKSGKYKRDPSGKYAYNTKTERYVNYKRYSDRLDELAGEKKKKKERLAALPVGKEGLTARQRARILKHYRTRNKLGHCIKQDENGDYYLDKDYKCLSKDELRQAVRADIRQRISKTFPTFTNRYPEYVNRERVRVRPSTRPAYSSSMPIPTTLALTYPGYHPGPRPPGYNPGPRPRPYRQTATAVSRPGSPKRYGPTVSEYEEVIESEVTIDDALDDLSEELGHAYQNVQAAKDDIRHGDIKEADNNVQAAKDALDNVDEIIAELTNELARSPSSNTSDVLVGTESSEIFSSTPPLPPKRPATLKSMADMKELLHGILVSNETLQTDLGDYINEYYYYRTIMSPIDAYKDLVNKIKNRYLTEKPNLNQYILDLVVGDSLIEINLPPPLF